MFVLYLPFYPCPYPVSRTSWICLSCISFSRSTRAHIPYPVHPGAVFPVSHSAVLPMPISRIPYILELFVLYLPLYPCPYPASHTSWSCLSCISRSTHAHIPYPIHPGAVCPVSPVLPMPISRIPYILELFVLYLPFYPCPYPASRTYWICLSCISFCRSTRAHIPYPIHPGAVCPDLPFYPCPYPVSRTSWSCFSCISFCRSTHAHIPYPIHPGAVCPVSAVVPVPISRIPYILELFVLYLPLYPCPYPASHTSWSCLSCICRCTRAHIPHPIHPGAVCPVSAVVPVPISRIPYILELFVLCLPFYPCQYDPISRIPYILELFVLYLPLYPCPYPVSRTSWSCLSCVSRSTRSPILVSRNKKILERVDSRI